MSAISTYLQRILNAIWAKDVRQAIHDAISQCYDDVNAPALQTEAMQAAVQAKIDAGEMAALTIADGSLTGAKLADGTIQAAKIADGAVTRGKIADNALGSLLTTDGNNINLWAVGGLGSKGENYKRATSIRTISRLPMSDYSIIVTSEDFITGCLCVYTNNSDDALHRYSISGNERYSIDSLLAQYPTAAYFRIEIAQCDGDTNAYNRVQLFMSDVFGSVTERLAETDENLRYTINAVNSLINYEYDEDANYSAVSSASATSATRIGVKRNKMIVELSGGDVNRATYVVLNGTIYRTTVASEAAGRSGFQLSEGKKYRATMQFVSGSTAVFENIAISIYKENVVGTIGTAESKENCYIREFTAPATPVIMAIYIPAYTVFSNEKVCVFLEEIESFDSTSYIEQGAKNINQYATQWQSNGLGSSGENVSRTTSIRTTSYWKLDNILRISVTGKIYLCLYSANNVASFIGRYSYEDTIINYDEIIRSQPTALYFRIELLEVEGAISAYDNVAIIGKKYAYGLDEQNKMYDKAVIFGQQRTTSEQYGNCIFRAMIVSDVHAEYGRLGNIIALMHKWGLNVFDALINCGDTVRAKQSDGIAWHNSLIPYIDVPYINVVGNHDAYGASLGALAEQSDTYQTIIEPISDQQGIIQPEDAQVNSLCYYYFDVNNKVRIIALDCMYWDSAEEQWLEEILATANTAGLYVVCVSHYGFGGGNAITIPSLWREVSRLPGDNINIASAEKVSDFISNGGKFVCWLVGHSHGDNLYKLTSDYNNQLIVTLPSLAQRAGTLLKNENADAYNYICATYMAIDDYSHTVRFMRIGANIDTWGIQHTGLVLDYENRELITAW